MNPDMNPGLGRGELAWAFGLDAFSFAVSAWTLSRVRALPAEARAAQPVSLRSRCWGTA